MALTDARPVPLNNSAFRLTFEIRKNDGTLISGAAGLSSQVSKDGGTFASTTNTPTEIATSSGVYYLDLTGSEMNAQTVVIKVTSSSTGAVPVVVVMYPASFLSIPVDCRAIDGSTFAASYQSDLLENSVVQGVVDTASFAATAAQFEADITVSIGAANNFAGRTVLFTSGALAGQAARITASVLADTRLKLTVTTMTGAPANADVFYIV